MMVLYTKSNCPLCAKAQRALREAGLLYEERDILEDPELFERYRYRIPVLVRDGVEVLEGQFDAAAVRRLSR